jgi:hypothetical protein
MERTPTPPRSNKRFNKLQHLHMRQDDLDTYVTTFKKLTEDAGYTLQETGTTRLVHPRTQVRITGRDPSPRQST